MRLRLQRDRLRSLTISFVSRFLAAFIIASFAGQLLPIANASTQDSMPCCAGKSSEHCDSGLNKPKPPPVVTEAMCGDAKPVAKSVNTSLLSAETTSRKIDAESNTSHVTAESITQTCRMDCGACATVSPRHKRQKTLVLARVTHEAPPTVTIHFETSVSFYSSNENWTRINPRGPPSVL